MLCFQSELSLLHLEKLSACRQLAPLVVKESDWSALNVNLAGEVPKYHNMHRNRTMNLAEGANQRPFIGESLIVLLLLCSVKRKMCVYLTDYLRRSKTSP